MLMPKDNSKSNSKLESNSNLESNPKSKLESNSNLESNSKSKLESNSKSNLESNPKSNSRATLAVGVGTFKDSLEEIKSNLFELEELIYSLDWDLVGSTYQRIERKNPKMLIGQGKLEEIKKLIKETHAKIIVFDHPLTGSQNRNLSKELGHIIIADRSQVIIDIFAQRAKTKEGKLQVELARLLDELPRMVGGWHGSLSRLGGGIGTRGPGESALEMDRRTIRNRIGILRKKLKDFETHRRESKKKRKNGIPKIALIGYTNAGKSTLMNTLTEAKTYAEDKLFATLDPLTRKIYAKELGEVVVTDTVGFINKIPTHLIEAFKTTLEESSDADLLLHVIDVSNPNYLNQIKKVEEIIESFGWEDKPMIHVYNKIDLLPTKKKLTFKKTPPFILSSATEGQPKDFWKIIKAKSPPLEQKYHH